MELRFRPFQTPEDRAKLKPSLGDDVWYEGKLYEVTEVGMRYLHVKDKTTGAPGIVKIVEVVKASTIAEADNEPSPFDDLK